MRAIWCLAIGVLVASVTLFCGGAAAEEKPVKLGAMFISSGKMGGYGKHGAQAIQLAVEEINAAGGILGRKLEATTEDTQLNKERTIEIAKRFILTDKVDFLMGPTSSGLAMTLLDIAKEHKKILIATQAATDALTGANFSPYLFSTLSNAMMHSRSGAYLMANKPYKRWMVVGPDYNYGHSSWEMFITKLKELKPDVEVVGEVFPKFMATDYSAAIEEVLKIKPDAVWCPLWGGDSVAFIKQALPKGLFDQVKFAFPVGGALETLIPVGKDMPEGIFMSTRYLFTTPDSALNRRFVKAYKERFNEYPDYMAGETYAGVTFIKAAVERAGSTDAEKIIAAVEKEPLAWESPEGWKIMRAEDHSVVEDCLWGETVFSEAYGFPVLKNIHYVPAEEICRTPEELKAVREGYRKSLQ
ncbi:ABC transporter substrate-binding protein [Desulfatiglans anilini]|uniref:ABC transporter substrate-binding protein n=1 Tax=Desulfatiglans anilini TaxID=90728 RepID=UPI0013786A0C|nr:ABC transporter substrate-binding protein [Desulfatiglans anilini]